MKKEEEEMKMSKKDKFSLMTTRELKNMRNSLLENIADWEKTMALTRSNLIQLCLIYYIKTARKEIYLIDTELEMRQKDE